MTADQLDAANEEILALEALHNSDKDAYYGTAGKSYTFSGEGVRRARALVASLANSGPGADPQKWQDIYRRASSLPQG